MSGGEKGIDEFEAEALKELAEIAAELKKTGLLGALKDALSSADAIMEAVEDDTGLLRLGVLAGALLEAARRLEGGDVAPLKMNVEDAGYCLLHTLSATKPGEAKPAGMLGLLKALGDPDVQRGLGFLLAVAKNLGACLGKLR